MSTLIDQYINHLEFLGYQIKRDESDNRIYARHKVNFNFTFKEYPYGGLFTAVFPGNPGAQNKRADALERVNAYNKIAHVARGYLNFDEEIDFYFEAFLPLIYDKVTFGGFIDMFDKDLQLAGQGEQKLSIYMS